MYNAWCYTICTIESHHHHQINYKTNILHPYLVHNKWFFYINISFFHNTNTNNITGIGVSFLVSCRANMAANWVTWVGRRNGHFIAAHGHTISRWQALLLTLTIILKHFYTSVHLCLCTEMLAFLNSCESVYFLRRIVLITLFMTTFVDHALLCHLNSWCHCCSNSNTISSLLTSIDKYHSVSA